MTLPSSVISPVWAALPSVRPKAPAPSVTAPVVIVPKPARRVVFASSVTSPILIGESTVSITPARFTVAGALAKSPLVKRLVPPAVPTVRLPVLKKVATEIEFADPPSVTSKAAPVASRNPFASETSPEIVAAPVCDAFPNLSSAAVAAVTEASVIAPEPLVSVVSLASVTAPRIRAVFVVAIVPAVLVLLGPDAVSRPPVKVVTSFKPSPSDTTPVLRKVVAAVTVVDVP